MPSSSASRGCWCRGVVIVVGRVHRSAIVPLPDGRAGGRRRPAGPSDGCVDASGQAVSRPAAACWNSRSISVSSASPPMTLRALEARPGPGEVVDEQEQDDGADHERPARCCPTSASENRTIRTTIQKIATQAIGLDQRPRLQTRSLEPLGRRRAQEDHDAVGGVQEDRADRGDDDDRDRRRRATDARPRTPRP